MFSSVLGVGGAMIFRPVLANGFKVAEMDVARSVRFLLLTTTLVGGLSYLFNADGFDFKVLILSIAISFGGAIGFPLGARAHRVIVKAGYAREARQSFAIICGIVATNVILAVLGREIISRYVMFTAAVTLLLFLLSWRVIAQRQINEVNDDK